MNSNYLHGDYVVAGDRTFYVNREGKPVPNIRAKMKKCATPARRRDERLFVV